MQPFPPPLPGGPEGRRRWGTESQVRGWGVAGGAGGRLGRSKALLGQETNRVGKRPRGQIFLEGPEPWRKQAPSPRTPRSHCADSGLSLKKGVYFRLGAPTAYNTICREGEERQRERREREEKKKRKDKVGLKLRNTCAALCTPPIERLLGPGLLSPWKSWSCLPAFSPPRPPSCAGQSCQSPTDDREVGMGAPAC